MNPWHSALTKKSYNMDKELVTRGDQEDSDSDEVRIMPPDKESGSEAEKSKWLEFYKIDFLK